jgi:hypothetical protein
VDSPLAEHELELTAESDLAVGTLAHVDPEGQVVFAWDFKKVKEHHAAKRAVCTGVPMGAVKSGCRVIWNRVTGEMHILKYGA